MDCGKYELRKDKMPLEGVLARSGDICDPLLSLERVKIHFQFGVEVDRGKN